MGSGETVYGRARLHQGWRWGTSGVLKINSSPLCSAGRSNDGAKGIAGCGEGRCSHSRGGEDPLAARRKRQPRGGGSFRPAAATAVRRGATALLGGRWRWRGRRAKGAVGGCGGGRRCSRSRGGGGCRGAAYTGGCGIGGGGGGGGGGCGSRCSRCRGGECESLFHIRSPQLFVCRPLLVILLMAIRQLRCYCLIHISLHFYYARSVFVGRHIGCLPNILDMHIGVFVQHIFEP